MKKRIKTDKNKIKFLDLIKGKNVPLKSDNPLQIFQEELDSGDLDLDKNKIVNKVFDKLIADN